MLSITLIIIIITVLISLTALNNVRVMNDLIFYPPAVSENRQYYRFITSGFIHADFLHLGFNMYAFYLFGSSLERWFMLIFPTWGKFLYVAMYITALIVCLLPTFAKHRNDSMYRSLGASGAVSAVIFAHILAEPLQGIGLVFLPGIFIPGFIFGLIYLGISHYLDKRGGGNINHSAHIWGALYGIGFFIAAAYLFSDYQLLQEFTRKISGYLGTF